MKAISYRWFGLLLALTFLATPVLGAGQDNPALVDEVLNKLTRLSNYSAFDWITFEVKGVDVTLKGWATKPTVSKDAERTVERIEGVGSVDNQIEVLPLSNNDDGIRARAYTAIYTHPTLQRYAPGGGTTRSQTIRELRTMSRWGIDAVMGVRGPHPIHMVVKSGNLLLLGSVATEMEKQMAEVQVRQLSGVFSVTNLLYVPEKQDK
jgi:hypothetical protein